MKYDLFISDFDGTLGRAPDIIEPETVEAIKKYTEKGGIFALCTGRMFSSVIKICRKYGFKGAVVSYQGAMINDIETGKCLFSGGIAPTLAASIVRFFKENNIAVIVDIDDRMFYDARTDFIDVYERSTEVYGTITKNIVEITENAGKKINKILGLCGREQAKYYTDLLQKKYEGKLFINNGAPILVEAVSVDCSKKFGVEFLAKYYNVPFDRVLAIGDSTNDKELLNGSWHKVAVGNACDELKRLADEVTVPFSEQPVKYLLEKYCL